MTAKYPVSKLGKDVVARNADEVNAPFDEKGWQPPYAAGTKVAEFTTATEMKFVRVHGTDNKARSWMMRQEDIAGLSPHQIKEKFTLPELPSQEVTIKMDFPIAQTLSSNDMIFVRFEIMPPDMLNENVVALNNKGKKKWNIETRKSVYNDSPYTSMSLENGNLKLGNWDGAIVIVDIATGKIVSENQGK